MRLTFDWRHCTLALVCASSLLAACSTVVRKNAPSIAHIHIGHAITAWPGAPKNQGLLVAAELAGINAMTNAELMLESARAGDLDKTRRFLVETANSVDPLLVEPSATDKMGLRRAAAEAITHLKLAGETSDASPNVQRTVTRSLVRASDILDRSDELLAFLDAGLESNDIGQLEIIAEEIVRTLRGVAGGPDLPDNYGLYNFRNDIEQMVAREDPPYETVDTWYLFNLVKLPDGQWGFASRSSRGAAGVGY